MDLMMIQVVLLGLILGAVIIFGLTIVNTQIDQFVLMRSLDEIKKEIEKIEHSIFNWQNSSRDDVIKDI